MSTNNGFIIVSVERVRSRFSTKAAHAISRFYWLIRVDWDGFDFTQWYQECVAVEWDRKEKVSSHVRRISFGSAGLSNGKTKKKVYFSKETIMFHSWINSKSHLSAMLALLLFGKVVSFITFHDGMLSEKCLSTRFNLSLCKACQIYTSPIKYSIHTRRYAGKYWTIQSMVLF